jgi:MoaA/NifB/PqqE/SkfB family radical SAM enzyme
VIARALEFGRRALFISPRVPRHVDIEISTDCNLACRMCKRETFPFGNQMMPYETFVKILDRLPRGVRAVSFGGYGEMLMHPRFFDFVRLARGRGFATMTTSNGTLLHTDERITALLECGLGELRISVDHVRAPAVEGEVGHVFSPALLRIVSHLAERRRGTPLRLGLNTVVHTGNVDEVLEIVRFADGLGLDLVELIRLDTCGNHVERTLQRERERVLYDEIERMPKRVLVVTPANRFAGRRRLYNLRQEFCPFRFESAHIRMNGAVTPCAFGFATHDFGNIHERTLEEICASPEFRAVRADDRNEVCADCAIFKW